MSLRDDLVADLVRDEGERLKPYKDTVGKLTIGVGRNLDDNGISQDECRLLLGNDIDVAIGEANDTWPWFLTAPYPVRRGLLNMLFNLGKTRLLGFQAMLGHLASREYAEAAHEAINSQWSAQVGDRAQRIADLFRSAEENGATS